MRPSSSTSTNMQEYESTADQHSGTRPIQGTFLARLVLGAAMAAAELDPFRSMSNVAHSSTAFREVNPKLLKRVRRLFDEGAHEFFEDGIESRFSRSLMLLLKQDGKDALSAIAEYLGSGNARANVAAETLRWLGDIGDRETLTARWQILKRSLSDKSPTVRDGAILGFANLNDPRAIQALTDAKTNEPITELRKLIDQVLEQLQNVK